MNKCYVENTVVEYRLINSLSKNHGTPLIKVSNPRHIPSLASVVNIDGDPYIVASVGMAIENQKQPKGCGAINDRIVEFIYINVTKANN